MDMGETIEQLLSPQYYYMCVCVRACVCVCVCV